LGQPAGDAVTGQHPRARVLLGDDHQMVAEGIAGLVRSRFDVLGVAGDGPALLEAALRERPDLILADIGMPGLGGIEVLRRLQAAGARIPIIFLTMHAEPAMVEEALDAGARGYILKSAAGDELLRAIDGVLDGGTYISPALLRRVLDRSAIPTLTARQRMVLGLLASGLRSREIAEQLDISVRTVEVHRQALLQALDARNSVELIRKAAQLGFVTPG